MSRTIVLAEYQPQRFPAAALSDGVAQRLWRDYTPFVTVDFPSPKTAGAWQLTAQGWVGMVTLTPDLTLVLQPKVPIANLLGMLELAYGLQSFQLLGGTVAATTIPELYTRLVQLLVTRVLQQIQRGLYRPYKVRAEATPFVRGRLQIQEFIRQPTVVTVPCRFHESTVDVVENRILYWTLHRILQSDLVYSGYHENQSSYPSKTFASHSQQRIDGETSVALSAALPVALRRALRAFQPDVTLQPCTVADCRGHTYTRLNQNYAALHALCAFFLEACGPSHLPGEVMSVPFVVNMARLFEQFVAAWLQVHLPVSRQLQIQERYPLGSELHFAIDLVLYDRAACRPHMVLDTKYKTPDRTPDTTDVAQIVAYAAAKGVTEAVLIYPQPLPVPLDTTVGGVHVRTATFALDGSLDDAGQALLTDLSLQEPACFLY